MFVLLWSLVINVISYVRRRRLRSQTEMQMARGYGVVLRLIRGDLESNGRRTIIGSPLYRTESVELVSSDIKPVLKEENWHKFEEVEIVSARSSNSSLSQVEDAEILNFVASVVVSDKKLHEFHTVSIDKEAQQLAWRVDENLEVLFSGSRRAFGKFVDTCSCASGILQYRDTFEVAQLRTVDLAEEFKKHLGLGCSQMQNRNFPSPPPPQSCSPPVFFKTLEELCITDIIASRHLCDSVMSQESVSETWTESDFSSCVVTPPESLNLFNLPTLSKSEAIGSHSSSVDDGRSFEVEILPVHNDSGPTLSHETPEKEIKDSLWGSDGQSDPIDMNSNCGPPKKSDRNSFTKPKFLQLDNDLNPGKSTIRRLSLSTQQIEHISINRISRTGSPQFRSLTSSHENSDLRSRSNSPQPSLKNKLVPAAKSGMKPPNILVYTGPADSKELQYQKLKSAILSCLDNDKYVVYRIKPENFCVAPWRDNTACLIVADTDGLDEHGWERLFSYFKNGGRMLFICQNKLLMYLKSCKSAKKRLGILKHAFANEASSKEFEKFLKLLSKKLKYPSVREQMEVRKYDGSLEYFISVIREDNSPLLLYMQNSHKRAGALFSDIEVETFLNGGGVILVKEALKRLELHVVDKGIARGLSPGYILCSDNQSYKQLSEFIRANPTVAGLNVVIEFIESKGTAAAAAAEKYLPVYILRDAADLDFKVDLYYSYLCTKTIGQVLLYIPVVTSTMKVFDKLASISGGPEKIVAVAKHQTQGQGRGGNNWLSPAGCAMFSFPLKVDLQSKLGRKLGYIQHLVALSIVDGICSLPGYETLELKLKWPNDIYYGAKVKLGGVLVNSSVLNNVVHCIIGCGINVDNEKPTLCVNQLLAEGIAPLSCEVVIARAVSRFEDLLEIFERRGLDGILPIYYKYWLHESQDVLVVSTGEHVVIRGLDDFGFLQVRSKHTGEVYSVQPDGNTFDMLHNTIRVK